MEGLRATLTFLESWRINHYYNVKFSAIWRQEKEERKSQTFKLFDVKMDILHRDIDRGNFDAWERSNGRSVSNGSGVCFIYFLFSRIFVFLLLSWYKCLLVYWYQKLCSSGSSNQAHGQDYTNFTIFDETKGWFDYRAGLN